MADYGLSNNVSCIWLIHPEISHYISKAIFLKGFFVVVTFIIITISFTAVWRKEAFLMELADGLFNLAI